MVEHYYTVEERVGQLKSLASALSELIPVAELTPAAIHVDAYRQAQVMAIALQQEGFTQGQLSSLARAIPDVVERHKDWMPPMRQSDAGHWIEEEWWGPLDEKLQRVLTLARTLQTLGYY